MIAIPQSERYRHDCDRCTYRGSSWSGPGKRYDWYTCGSVTGDGSIIRRNSDEPSDYLSAALFSSAADFDFVRVALREGILRISVNEDYKPSEDY